GNSQLVKFHQDVDPEGILKNAPSHLVHLQDNEVAYYERYTEANSKVKYRYLNPAEFRTGHVVEIQCTFSTVFENISINELPVKKTIRKRKTGYDCEDDQNSSKRQDAGGSKAMDIA
ncbi:hypothetical protein FA95DRAFT_1578937, partial [Auriscalpium vulgare]